MDAPHNDPNRVTATNLDRLRRLESQFLRPHRATIALATGGMLVQSLLALPVPMLQGWVLDRVVTTARASMAALGLAVAAMVACHAARAVLGWWVAARMSRVSLDVVRDLTDAMHRKLQRLPLSYYDRQETGRVMARITSDVGSLLIFLGGGSLQLLSDLVLAAGVAAAMAWLQWRLAAAALAVVPLYVLSHRALTPRVRALTRETRARLAAVYALLSERVSAVRVVRSFAQEEAEVAEFDRRLDEHRDAGLSGLRAGALQSSSAAAIGGLGTVGVVALGAVLVARGSLTVGELLAFYGLVGLLYGPITRLVGFQGVLAATRVAVERMAEVLDEPETVTDRPGARPLDLSRVRGGLSYRGVHFAYAPDGRPVLDGIDLEIEPGMTVGVLGPSGSGKSTLLALAPRLYDIPDGRGSALLDGQDVRDLRLADLRRAVALVPQQAILFEGTIRSNLLYARPDAPPTLVRRALEASDLAATADALPLGLDTPVGDRGFTLSGGQRQRLALARALVADPSVLLLDDCTSALDAETERRVRRALAEMRPGRTTLVVSHKVASVRAADLILVLDSGRVIESGPHASLLALGGRYAELYRLQTSGLALAAR